MDKSKNNKTSNRWFCCFIDAPHDGLETFYVLDAESKVAALELVLDISCPDNVHETEFEYWLWNSKEIATNVTELL